MSRSVAPAAIAATRPRRRPGDPRSVPFEIASLIVQVSTLLCRCLPRRRSAHLRIRLGSVIPPPFTIVGVRRRPTCPRRRNDTLPLAHARAGTTTRPCRVTWRSTPNLFGKGKGPGGSRSQPWGPHPHPRDFPGPPDGPRPKARRGRTIALRNRACIRRLGDTREKPQVTRHRSSRARIHRFPHAPADNATDIAHRSLYSERGSPKDYSIGREKRSAIWMPFNAAPFRRLSPHANRSSESS